jgi:hypothetical protein
MAHVTIEMTGTSPLVLHNIRLSDPFDPMTKQIAELTKKRRKTEEDHHNIAKLEWFGGLYTDDTGTMPGLVVPCANLRKCLINTARTTKQGKQVERALAFTSMVVPLRYDGPTDLDALYALEAHCYRTAVRVSTSVVQRMRPRFPIWRLQAEAFLLEDLLDLDDVQRIVALAGLIEGIGDGRTLGFGRFEGKVSHHA